MYSAAQLSEIVRRLPERRETRHFVLHYGKCHSRSGRGLGAHGIWIDEIIRHYADGLEGAYETLRARFGRPSPPGTRLGGKTPVYVFEISELIPEGCPFTTYDPGLAPYICLPSRTREPTREAERHRALADAVHEATHIFNFMERPYHDPSAAAWAWFDEATAVLTEAEVLTDNPDRLRFGLEWVTRPEVPLDHPSGWYQAGLFAAYLADRRGREFISDAWTGSAASETALDALTRGLGEAGLPFSDPDPQKGDLFASGYCVDSYFSGQGATALANEVCGRHGERAVAGSFELGSGQSDTLEDLLDHLACRYYRIYPARGASQISAVVGLPPASRSAPLKAHLIPVGEGRRRGNGESLVPRGSVSGTGGLTLEGSLRGDGLDGLDHAVLVVVNCGTQALYGYDGSKNRYHDDRVRFTVTAAAR